MTTPEKCRMLLELAKKAISPFYPHSYNGRAFQEAVNPTAVQEICEAYLALDSEDKNISELFLQQEARIQELEAALAQAVDQLIQDYTAGQLDGHGALIRKLEATLAKARKVGG